MQLIFGEHTRPRVLRPAPSPVASEREQSPNGLDDSRSRVFREGAEHGTRGRVRSPFGLHGSGLGKEQELAARQRDAGSAGPSALR